VKLGILISLRVQGEEAFIGGHELSISLYITGTKIHIQDLLEEYKAMNFDQALNHEKFNLYSIVHHSTAIEGSSLSELETSLLLDEGVVSAKRSFHDHLTVKDHYEALLFTFAQARKKESVTVSLLQEIAGLVMKNTGREIKAYGGKDFDESRGELRTISVTAGAGDASYLKPERVPDAFKSLCTGINTALTRALTVEEQILLSFDAHFNFETIHPFGDGNGRTGRLLMNYIQVYFGLPPAIIRKENKSAYIAALIASREQNDLEPIRAFLFKEYSDQLRTEIDRFKEDEKKSLGQISKMIQMMGQPI